MKKAVRLIVFFFIICSIISFNIEALGNMDYVLDNNSKKIFIPQTHTVKRMIKTVGGSSTKLTEPSDLFIDKNDNIYIADTGNNRIVKFNSNGEYEKEFLCDGSFSSPSGIFVSDNGDLYVADTLNEQIVHMDLNGNIIEKFIKPTSELLSDNSTFQVSKIGITSQGYLYTLQGQYFMMIDADNQFKGYIGDNHLGFSLTRILIRSFASKEQQKKLIKEIPSSYYSFDIASDGLIYATTGENSSSNQIQKINMVGENIFPKKFYGEAIFNQDVNRYVNPRFVDICVDNSGLIYVIEAYSKNIYIYNQTGDMLGVFGGNGTVKGKFNKPVSIDNMSNGDTLILDQATGYIHWFTNTRFMNGITESVSHYSNGEYKKCENSWKKVLDIDANYSVANKGIADSLLKQKKEKEAMKYYKLSDNKSGFGTAFSDYQYLFIRKYFGWVVLAIASVVAGFVFLLLKLKKKSDTLVKDYYSGGKK